MKIQVGNLSPPVTIQKKKNWQQITKENEEITEEKQ
jgi:hypothetical protein